ncbi:MAG: hypothetical protein JWN67_144 [Actinomycetia bacterium]|nr:hypothetical protein [Actinomycetes bacterium]
MDGSFSVDTGALRRAGARVSAIAEHLEIVRRAPEPGGTPWGDDPPGQRFGAGYVCSAEGLEARAASLVSELHEVGARLAEMAYGYEAADDGSRVP